MAKSDLLIRIGADIQNLKKGMQGAVREMKRAGREFTEIGRSLTLGVSAPLGLVGAAAVKTFADFDKLEKGLAAITGSTSEAKRQFKALLDVTKDVRTTLDLKTAVSASLQLQAVGIDAANATNAIKQLGIAATVSGASVDDIGEIARQFAQIAANGKVLQADLRIILQRVPALAAVIKKEFGTTTAEGLNDAGVSAEQFIKRLTGAIEKNEQFQNVQASLAKTFETFTLEVRLAGAELGKTIANSIGLQDILQRVSNVISNLVQGFSNLSPVVQKTILTYAALAVGIGPVIFGLGTIIKFLPVLRVGFAALGGPIGLAVAALAALVPLVISLAQGTDRVTKATNDASKAIQKEQIETGLLFDKLKDTNVSQEERAKILDDLKTRYPGYLGNLSVEKSSLEDIEKAQEGVNKAIVNRIALEKKAVAQGEIGEKIANKLLRIAELENGERAKASELASRTFIRSLRPNQQRLDLIAALKKEVGGLNEDLSKLDRVFDQAFDLSAGASSSSSPSIPDITTNASAAVVPKSPKKEAEKIKEAYAGPFDFVSLAIDRAVESVKLFGSGIAPLLTDGEKLERQLEAQSLSLDKLDQSSTSYNATIRELKQNQESQNEQTRLQIIEANALQELLQGIGQQLGLVFDENGQAFIDFTSIGIDSLNGLIDGFVNSITSAKSFGQAVGEVFRDLLARIAKAVAAAAAFSLILGAFSGGGSLFSGFGGNFLSILKGGFKIPGLARGGVVPPGFPNDSFPAFLSSGETVLPSPRSLDSVFGNIGLRTLLAGQDILLASDRSARNRERIRGY